MLLMDAAMTIKPSTVGERIKAERKKLKLSQEQFGKRLEKRVTGATVSDWERNITEPSGNNLNNICKLTGVTADYILHGSNSPHENVTSTPLTGRRVPVLNYVQAGAWKEASDYRMYDGNIEWIEADWDYSDNTFGLVVVGDSMAPDFLEGDVLVIDPNVDPLPGDFVVAKNGQDEATFKRYRPKGFNDQGIEYFELVPSNENYPKMRSDKQEIRIIGTMMEYRRKRKKY
ncbi:helix-turn-helix domain-containing protein [Plesiomonas shigelloides]|nr:helix-turn-helix domain-containing protein [Plesiomonas shigelloides]